MTKKRSCFLLGFLAFLILLCIVGAGLISRAVHQNKDNITLKIRQEIGFPIAFDKLGATWHGFSLGLAIKNAVISDCDVPIPFISIDKIQVFPDLITLLFEHRAEFKKIILTGTKLVIQWDEKNGFSILGLKGESIPTNIDYETCLALISKQQNIILENAQIDWRGSSFKVMQRLSGNFQWVRSQLLDWTFDGTQQLQISEGLVLPSADIKVFSTPKLEKISLETSIGKSQGQCQLINHDKQPQDLDCSLSLKNIDIASFRQSYQPKLTDNAVIQWIFEALSVGEIKKGELTIKGPTNALQCLGFLSFKNTDIQYSPQWPKITKANGKINIVKDAVKIQLHDGKILDSVIETAVANVERNEKNKKMAVIVEGSVKSTLEEGLLFLQQSPLNDSIAQNISFIGPRGAMHLDLKLNVPLQEQIPVQVKGLVIVKDGQLDIQNNELQLTHLNGGFHFTEQSLDATEVKANFGDQSLNFNLKTDTLSNHKELQISTSLNLSSEFLQSNISSPLVKEIQGKSLFVVSLNLPLIMNGTRNEIEWDVRSDLKGMAFKLPGFLSKKTDDKLALTLKIVQPMKGEKKLSLHLDKFLDGKFSISKSAQNFTLKRGHVVFGNGSADWTTKNALLVGGEIPSFKLSEWVEFLDKTKLGVIDSFPALNIHVLVNQLEINNLHFAKTWVTGDLSRSPSEWIFEGPFVKGVISFASKEHNQLDLDLDYLKIVTKDTQAISTTRILREQAKLPIIFHCKDLQYDHGHFGEVSFKLIPQLYGYEIQELNLTTPISEVTGSGQWHFEEGKSYTTLEGKVISVNMGETLSAWGYPSAIRESSGHIKYQIRWEDVPFQFNMSAVDGTAELKFSKGRILGVNPGIGRIMGLLNLESIRRRLQLDFSDLLKKGFVFDTLKGNFVFKEGVANTQELLIDGPSAKIALEGTADFKDKAIDLKMTVIPQMGVGIPIAAAIAAGNPAIGAGVWFLDKITGSKINKLNQHDYHVTGTWDSPSIQDLGERARKQKSTSK